MHGTKQGGIEQQILDAVCPPPSEGEMRKMELVHSAPPKVKGTASRGTDTVVKEHPNVGQCLAWFASLTLEKAVKSQNQAPIDPAFRLTFYVFTMFSKSFRKVSKIIIHGFQNAQSEGLRKTSHLADNMPAKLPSATPEGQSAKLDELPNIVGVYITPKPFTASLKKSSIGVERAAVQTFETWRGRIRDRIEALLLACPSKQSYHTVRVVVATSIGDILLSQSMKEVCAKEGLVPVGILLAGDPSDEGLLQIRNKHCKTILSGSATHFLCIIVSRHSKLCKQTPPAYHMSCEHLLRLTQRNLRKWPPWRLMTWRKASQK